MPRKPHTASVAAQRGRTLAIRTKQTARSAVLGLKAIGKTLAAAVKAAAAAMHSLAATLVAGGSTAVVVVLLVCLIAMVVGSPFGIFFSAQPTGSGISLQEAVRQLSEDYHARIREIEQNNPHDRVEYLPNDRIAIRWQDVLSVFAAEMAGAENGQAVAVLETAQIDRLREIL